ncbi:MAG: hypothetical protein NT013_17515 [Planctomycetia bacterium]|nr:hypothetical protein [Planctomycetia bacterium]
MAIEVTCDCGKTYRVNDDKAGKRFKCRECAMLVRVPNENGDDTNEDVDIEADELGIEPEAKYVPMHRRLWARRRSAKKDARTKSNAAARNRWLLIAGKVFAVMVLVALIFRAIVWADVFLRPEQKTFLWLTVGVPSYFLLSDRMNRSSIRRRLSSYDETVEDISWRPFRNFFNINGGWPPHLFYYEVYLLDRYGKAQLREVAFVRRRGMVWDDDI